MAEGEWEPLRRVRLEMLADTPSAYVESLESAQAQTVGQWRNRAVAMTAPGSVTFVAEEVPGALAFCGLMRVVVKQPQETNRPLQAMLISVYVAAPYRGTGLADELLRRSVAVAADELGAGILQLGVHEDNTRAAGFYARHGFHDTGRREVYPLDPSNKEIIMERELSPAGPEA
ncbi:GNAT family N-acetyltransferase [Arthrobacter oryzae]|uniref:GNAT family N-acetyltransferase n=1 Tax=Arthrobacter oryzae TaxID=409290 RepID=UPI0027807B65|nr:N-acetyltransferase [Arthrobacter oryzae]MDQ0077086.1 ribosomal protein S18 acetylase RimI-like enzyme [Arthrobacter oryzae]